MTVRIVTDSNSQFPAELADRYGVAVVPLTVVVDGESFAEGIELTADDFYARFEDAGAALGWWAELGGPVVVKLDGLAAVQRFDDLQRRTELVHQALGVALGPPLTSVRPADLG